MIEFNEHNHTYLVDDQFYPSVTYLLRKWGILQTRWYKPGSKEKGAYVHSLIEQIDSGGLLPGELQGNPFAGYVQAHQKFMRDHDYKVLDIERIVAHEQYRYAGKIDRIAMVDGEMCIIDIKSGGYEEWHPLQINAYGIALEGEKIFSTRGRKTPLKRVIKGEENYNVPKRLCLHLRPNGKYTLRDYSAKYFAECWMMLLKAAGL